MALNYKEICKKIGNKIYIQNEQGLKTKYSSKILTRSLKTMITCYKAHWKLSMELAMRMDKGRLFHNLGLHTVNALYRIRIQTKGGERGRSEADKYSGRVSKRKWERSLYKNSSPFYGSVTFAAKGAPVTFSPAVRNPRCLQQERKWN